MAFDEHDWNYLTKWPDFLQYRRKQDGSLEALFVVERGNSRALPGDRAFLLNLLEELGLTVKVNVSGNLISLKDFQRGGMYASNHKILGKQTTYNYRSELKSLEGQLMRMTPTDPQRDELTNRINRMREFLSLTPEEPKITSSDSALSALERQAEVIRKGILLHEMKQRGASEEEINAVLFPKPEPPAGSISEGGYDPRKEDEWVRRETEKLKKENS